MGIDVFGVFQKQTGGQWIYIRHACYGYRDRLRTWLGWDEGGLLRVTAISPLRGLPFDFDYVDGIYKPDATTRVVVGDRCFSWLLADEILNALPALAMRTLTVPLHIYQKTWNQECDPTRWKELTGLCQETDLPKLVGVSSRPQDVSYDTKEVPVDCMYDFSDEIRYFTDEVRHLRDTYGNVRFIYGFA